MPSPLTERVDSSCLMGKAVCAAPICSQFSGKLEASGVSVVSQPTLILSARCFDYPILATMYGLQIFNIATQNLKPNGH